MAAKHPPYHLRTNKAVDRLLLLRQVRSVINANVGLSEHSAYHSLGGPFMEDLHLMHFSFPEMDLVCIESDLQTHRRQKAHAFSANLSFENLTFSDFFATQYSASKPDIFWLDYTDLSLPCLSDLQALLRVLLPGSVVRITLQCDSPTNDRNLPSGLDEKELLALKQRLKEKFISKFDRFVPAGTHKAPLPSLPSGFAKLVQSIVRLAVSDALDRSSDREFLHLHTARYNDGTPMISITGLVCERKKMRSTVKRLNKFPAVVVDRRWLKLDEINVPVLSIQERMSINKALPYSAADPAVGEALYTLLNYHVSDSRPKSIAALEQYANYRHEYPSFVRLNSV